MADSVHSYVARAHALRSTLAEQLADCQAESARNPLSNPVERVAVDLARQLEAGALGVDDIEDLLRLLTVRAFEFRAKRLQAYFGDVDVERDADALRALLRRLSATEAGGAVPFETFRDLVEREAFGIVVTGHPTFGMTGELTAVLASLGPEHGSAGPPSAEARAMLLERAAQMRHGPPAVLDLATEREAAAQVIANIQAAFRRIYAIVLEVARERYPERWIELVPRLVTIANWVGYDTDGRSDIRWSDIVRARLNDAVEQLERYATRAGALGAELAGAARSAAAAAEIHRLEMALADLAERSAEARDLVPTAPDDVERTSRFNRRLAQDRGERIVDVGPFIDTLTRIIETGESSEECRLALAVLRAEMANYGMAGAHIHFRVNAIQLTNAIRKEAGIESAPDELADRRRYLRALNDLLDGVKPVTTHFGSILNEGMSARRIFMVLAQLMKYVDARTPVRFLIAESDTTFTLLSALYFARLFAIADRVDISPLFETVKGLEHGHEVVDELLRNEHFRAYARERGRLCIETGFSDAGRYIGQVAASLAIERLRIKVGEVIARHGLQDELELVVFDTHGESIGRGAHPVSFQDRLDYVYTPAGRQAFVSAGLSVKHEVSFQGGDGYVYFASADLAFATVSRLLYHALSSDAACAAETDDIRRQDLFYADTDYSLDFFLTIKEFNERMVDDHDYAALLLGVGRNLLYTTGSRRVKREGASARPFHEMRTAQMRAIPHNGVLQQLGYLANSVGGIGAAIAKDQDRFAEVLAGSARCRRIMSLAAYAFALGSLDAFQAYANLFDPAPWLARARRESDEHRRRVYQRVARRIAATGWHDGPGRVARALIDDAVDFQSALDALGDVGLVPPVAGDCHPDLELLHVVRLALIQRIFLLAARLPRFTPQEGVTIDEVIEQILALDVPAAIAQLKATFPVDGRTLKADAFGEPATYQAAGRRSYDEEHHELFDPMLRLHELVRRVSVCISHVMGAVG